MPLLISLVGVVGLLLIAGGAGGAARPAPHNAGGGTWPPEWTEEDFRALDATARRLGMNPADLLVVIWSESGGHPWAQYPKAPAYPIAAGLNEITAVAASTAGLTEEQRVDMVHWTVAQQIPVVEHFFRNSGWKYSYPNAGGVYAINAAGGRVVSKGSMAPDVVLYTTADGLAYERNSAFDTQKKGSITIQDLIDHLRIVASRPDFQGALQALRYSTGNGSLTPNLPSG